MRRQRRRSVGLGLSVPSPAKRLSTCPERDQYGEDAPSPGPDGDAPPGLARVVPLRSGRRRDRSRPGDGASTKLATLGDIDDATDEWAEHAGGWDDDPAARAYAAAAHRSLLEVVADHGLGLAGTHVLDFGCGTGLLTELLVDTVGPIDAVDTSPTMLAVLDRKVADRAWTTVTLGSVVPDSTFDLIVCSSVCSFLDDYPATVADLVGRLRPGGVFVQWDWERVGDDPHGLGRDEIRSALTLAGLEQIDVRTAFSVDVGEQTMDPLIGHGRRPTSNA